MYNSCSIQKFTQEYIFYLLFHDFLHCWNNNFVCVIRSFTVRVEFWIVLQNVEIQNAELQNAENIQNVDLQNAKLQNVELQNVES